MNSRDAPAVQAGDQAPARQESRPTLRELVWLPVVLAALLVVYLPGLNNELVFDDEFLASGELFREYASAASLKVRMLSYGSFVWVRELLGDGWWKQRLLNVAIHILVVLALWALYREVLRHIDPPAAETPDGVPLPPQPLELSPALGVAIGFFALNPAAVYAVAYVIQRSILMATMFLVAGLWLFARGLATKRPVLHLAALVCYVLAVMSKEHAILAPLAAVPLYVVIARPSRRRLAGIAAMGLVLVGAAAAVLLVRYGEIIGKPIDEYSHVYLAQLSTLDPKATQHAFGLNVINQAYLFFHYGLRWIVPASGWMSINLRPPFPVTLLTLPHVAALFAYGAILLGGSWLVLRHRDWRALAGLALLVPALLFLTEFAVVWVQDPFVIYRSYLWAIGVPALVILVLHGLPVRVLAVVAVTLCAVLVWQSVDRVQSLSTAERAWSDAIAKLPSDPRAVGRWFPYLNRGAEYVEASQFTLALRDFEASSRLGDMGMGAFNKGAVLSATGKPKEALAALDEAERQGYRMYNLPFQRAQALLALGRVPEAYQQLQNAAAMNPPSPTRELVLLHVGRSALQLGKHQEAIAALEQLIAAEPANREALLALSMAYSSSGHFARAAPLADRLVREGAGGMAYYARAIAHYGLKRKVDAVADIDAAVQQLPDNPNLREWQAKIRAMP